MKQTNTIGVRVPLLPRDATTREGVEIVLSAAFDAITEQAQDQGYDLLWNHLSVSADEEVYSVREHNGREAMRSSRSLQVSVLGVRDVKEDE